MTKNTKYVSEATEFIRGLLKEQPLLSQKQKKLRSTWWDTNGIDEEEQKSYKDSAAPVHGYCYYDSAKHA